MLKLSETNSDQYKAVIDKKFLEGLIFPLVFNEGNIDQFLSAIPLIKQIIVKVGKRSPEIEYEQMIIRANNYEPRNNLEYFIVDKQYAVKEGLAALRTLEFSKEIEKFQFILVLVDYNPNSSKLDLQRLRDLSFVDQIKVFFGGFAMWQQNVKPLGDV